MPEQLQPSAPGPDFSSADVARATIGPEDAGRIILQFQQQGSQAGSVDSTVALLAGLLKAQFNASAKYLINAFTVGNSTTPFQQQIVGENPLRKALILFVGTTTVGNINWLLDGGPTDPTPLSVADANALNTRTFAIGGGNNTFMFLPVPTNPVTVICDNLGMAAGIIFEGI